MRRKTTKSDVACVDDNYVAFGCDIGDGWYDLLHGLCEEITAIYIQYGADVDIVVDQVKEKYGGLRFYYHREGILADETANITLNRQIENIVEQYEERSEHVCEECGNEGILRNDLSWISTLCDNCYKRRNAHGR